MRTGMRTGEAIIDLLESYGVDTVFGIPGTHSIELYRALSGSTIKHVLPRHEQGAGFMADGYARVTGKPGVCFVITGPGVTNIATPMGEAFSDSIPMLVISPVNDAHADGINRGRLHELTDQSAVTAPFTAFSVTAKTAEQIPVLIERAFNVFYSARPLPVHISIPLSLLRVDTQVSWEPTPLPMPPAPTADEIAKIVSLLEIAKTSVLVAGGGCRHFGELVVTLAEKAAIPVVTTVAGRGVIAGSHPLCAGAQLANTAAQQLIADSDLLIVVGSELAEPDHWTDGLDLPENQVWINLDPAVLTLHEQKLTLLADARLALAALSQSIERTTHDRMQLAFERIRRVRDKHQSGFSELQQTHWRVWTELRKHLPPETCVFSDMTQLAYTAIDHMPLERPNTWMHPNGYGTLGYALPAGIGAKFAQPTLPVLVVVGDAGFQYTLGEMAVAAEHQLNLVVLLWNNDRLQQIRDDMVDAGITPVAITQQNPDFVELALLYGWEALSLNGLFELGPALASAFAATGPVLLELPEAVVQ